MSTSPLILASSSPRRRLLLEEAGYDFVLQPPPDWAECGICSRETPPELVARLAYQKAESVAAARSEGIVIGCDTVAECMGSVLGKPKNREHAAEMLNLMRGREHSVYSGLCLWDCATQTPHVEVDRSVLHMREFSADALEEHLDSGDWQGKAGAFGFQDGLDWLELRSGSVSNIVGLPMELLDRMLTKIGWSQD